MRGLEIDRAVRDKLVAHLERRLEKADEQQLAQSRYIGHLETLAIEKGASPEAKFLASPRPISNSGHEIPVGDFRPNDSENLRYNADNANA